jgi:Site-specific recombinases, DNA invertase Pin homologs
MKENKRRNGKMSNAAVIYIRVSTTEQAEFGYSLKAQEQLCSEYAKRNNYDVLKVFIEKGESAKTTNRTELKNMLSYIKANKNKVNALIIYKMDRLSRDMFDSLSIRIMLKKLEIELKSVTEPFDDNTSMGTFTATLFSSIAQLDNDVRSERTKLGMTQAIEEGRWLWNAPLGYSFEYVNQKSYLVPDDKAVIIKKIFSDFISGKKQYEIIQELKLSGINLTRQHINNILRNYLYIGKIKTKLVKEIITGLQTPLIDEVTFYKAQDILNPKRNKTYGFTYSDEFPLKRFLKCPYCNRNLAGSYSKGRHKKYPYYHCTTKGCCFKGIRTDFAEYLFLQYLKSYEMKKNVIDKIFSDLKTHLEDTQQDNKNIIFNIKRDITALESNREKIEKLVIEGTFDKSTYLRNRDEIGEQIISKKILLEDYENGLIDVTGLLEFGKRFVHNLSSLWLNMETLQRRGFQEILFPEGLTLENGEFRTAIISPILSLIRAQNEALISSQATLAGVRGFEPQGITLINHRPDKAFI